MILQDLLSAFLVQENANANLELLQELGLENEFSDTRQKRIAQHSNYQHHKNVPLPY